MDFINLPEIWIWTRNLRPPICILLINIIVKCII